MQTRWLIYLKMSKFMHLWQNLKLIKSSVTSDLTENTLRYEEFNVGLWSFQHETCKSKHWRNSLLVSQDLVICSPSADSLLATNFILQLLAGKEVRFCQKLHIMVHIQTWMTQNSRWHLCSVEMYNEMLNFLFQWSFFNSTVSIETI
jgi:hypothetical protein